MKNRIDSSLISFAGLVGTDLCMNITALNSRGEGGRSGARQGKVAAGFQHWEEQGGGRDEESGIQRW